MQQVFLLPLLLSIIWCQSIAQWSQNQLNTLQCQLTQPKQYQKGDTMTICLHLIPHAKKLSFNVNVDSYTALKMKNIFNFVTSQSVTADKLTYLVVQAGGQTPMTYPNVYYQLATHTNSTTRVYAIYSVLVKLNNGNIQSVDWDNGCYGCSTNNCVINTNYLNNNTYSNCAVSPICVIGQTDTCDPQVYVSFMGTDSQGNYLTSAGLRFSQFQSYSIGELYNAALNLKF